MSRRPWTTDDLLTLHDDWPRSTPKALAGTLGRTVEAVTRQARRLGLPRHAHWQPWLTTEVARLRAMRMRGESWDAIAGVLRRKARACRRMANKLATGDRALAEWLADRYQP
jgi:hypothetical protein